MKPAQLAIIFAFLAVLCWAPNSAIGKLLVGELDSYQIRFFTSLFSAITMLLIILLQGKANVLIEYKPKDWLNLSAIGFIGVFLAFLFFFESLKRLPAQETMILFYFFPIPTALLGILFLREKASLKGFLAMLISFFGAIVVITKGDVFSMQFTSVAGVLFGLAAALAHAFFSILDKKHEYEKFTANFVYFAVAAALSLLTVLAFSAIPSISMPQLLGLLAIGAVVGGLGYTFFLLALKDGETSAVSNIMLLTPFVSLLFISVLANEQILLSSIIGLAMILAGIAFQSMGKSR